MAGDTTKTQNRSYLRSHWSSNRALRGSQAVLSSLRVLKCVLVVVLVGLGAITLQDILKLTRLEKETRKII